VKRAQDIVSVIQELAAKGEETDEDSALPERF